MFPVRTALPPVDGSHLARNDGDLQQSGVDARWDIETRRRPIPPRYRERVTCYDSGARGQGSSIFGGTDRFSGQYNEATHGNGMTVHGILPSLPMWKATAMPLRDKNSPLWRYDSKRRVCVMFRWYRTVPDTRIRYGNGMEKAGRGYSPKILKVMVIRGQCPRPQWFTIPTANNGP